MAKRSGDATEVMTSTWYVRRLHALDGTLIDELAVARGTKFCFKLQVKLIDT